MSKLFLVGTPIGNLGDISQRALETLKNADFIAAEDTRVTVKLLSRFDIKKPMISYYEHNIRERGEQIIARILAGESCALVTDAGMPCISDPGEDLVRLCAENGVETVVVPGPSAAVSALSVSGLATGRFSFEGFLSVKPASRFSHLNEISSDTRTLIFYEAPHKLPQTLNDMLEVFGDRRITLVRELTKLHEEVRRTTLAGAAAFYAENTPRGEFVLVVEGAKPPEKIQMTFEDAALMAKELMADGLKATQAAKQAAQASGFKKSELYKQLSQY